MKFYLGVIYQKNLPNGIRPNLLIGIIKMFKEDKYWFSKVGCGHPPGDGACPSPSEIPLKL